MTVKKCFVLLVSVFMIFSCTQNCFEDGTKGKSGNKNDNPTITLQDIVDNSDVDEEIDLSDYKITDYTAVINKKLTIKN